jgi:hypothetical protein
LVALLLHDRLDRAERTTGFRFSATKQPGELVDDHEEPALTSRPKEDSEQSGNVREVWSHVEEGLEDLGEASELGASGELLGHQDDRWLAVREPAEEPRLADPAPPDQAERLPLLAFPPGRESVQLLGPVQELPDQRPNVSIWFHPLRIL